MASRISERLISEGRQPSTPVRVMANVSRQNSVSWSGALSDLALGVDSLATDGPVLIAVGEVFANVGQAAEAALYHDTEPRTVAAN